MHQRKIYTRVVGNKTPVGLGYHSRKRGLEAVRRQRKRGQGGGSVVPRWRWLWSTSQGLRQPPSENFGQHLDSWLAEYYCVRCKGRKKEGKVNLYCQLVVFHFLSGILLFGWCLTLLYFFFLLIGSGGEVSFVETFSSSWPHLIKQENFYFTN